MKALIFAAGRGKRMRPLTDATPKPLLEVGGKPLIVWHLERCAAAGIGEVIINTAHLASRFPEVLGDGSQWGLQIRYSHEGHRALETGGGLLHALPLLGEAPFIVVSGDIWCDFDLAALPRQPAGLAHLLLVDNPAHHRFGDFRLAEDGKLQSAGEPVTAPFTPRRLTFAGIAVCRPELLAHWHGVIGDTDGVDESPPRFRLAPLFHAAAAQGQLTGQRHAGAWTDVGTPERLRKLAMSL